MCVPFFGGFYHEYWARIVLRGSARDLVSGMRKFVARSHANPSLQVASCLFPEIKTNDQLSDLIVEIRDHYAGALTAFEDSTGGPFTLIRVRLPLSKGITAYALGFGPFDWMPATRQAPHTELVLPVKTKQQLRVKYGRFSISQSQPDSKPRHEDPTFVHLADVEMEGVTKDTATDLRYWEATLGLKKARLQGDLSDRAKGKVTFCYPGLSLQFKQAG